MRHNAERADVVATLHHRDERRHVPARGLGIGTREDVLLAVYPAGLEYALASLHAVDDLRKRRDLIRTQHEVEIRHAAQQLLLPLLRHTPRHAESRPALVANEPVAPERAEHLGLGLLPNGARVQDDEVG